MKNPPLVYGGVEDAARGSFIGSGHVWPPLVDRRDELSILSGRHSNLKFLNLSNVRAAS